MVAEKPQTNLNIASLDTEQSDIWKRLTIIKTEAWFNTVQAIAMEHQVRAKLESRYMKSAIICDRTGRRIGRVWHLDENMPIFWDIKKWVSHYESANTLAEAIDGIASTVVNI